MKTLYSRLLAQALPHCTAAEAGAWPCEIVGSRHWATLAAEGRWRVCVRTEPDEHTSGADYEEPPEPGTEWVGLVVQLQDSYGTTYRTEALWGIETPGLRSVPASDWQACEGFIADTARELLEELLADPAPVISNLYGQVCEREACIRELLEVAS